MFQGKAQICTAQTGGKHINRGFNKSGYQRSTTASRTSYHRLFGFSGHQKHTFWCPERSDFKFCRGACPQTPLGKSCQLHLQWPLVTNVIETPALTLRPPLAHLHIYCIGLWTKWMYWLQMYKYMYKIKSIIFSILIILMMLCVP